MVRRHGWQLPAHTFQVVAITVFFLLAIAFYVFFAPFLGSDALQYAAIAVYSPVAFAVLLLYIRCSAIDPSDPGIFVDQGEKPFHKHTKGVMYAESSPAMTLPGPGVPQSPGLDTPARSSSVARFDKEINAKLSYMEAGQTGWPTRHTAQRARCFFCCGIFGFLCGWIVKADNCKREAEKEPQMGDEDVLFCTLCNAEVRKFSKHCRSCDKCVDGFDHHCRWLNNCVGRKNYVTFISLMASSLTLLVLEWGIGVAVLVRCFIDKRGTESQIVDKLGNSFTRAPFAAVVALCTLVPLLASLPLGELFFFHILLIRKGITTYEYVVAMRAQSEPQGHEEQSIPSSPSSSTATGLSASSSVGLPYRGAWCTPPRIFVEHQDEIIPHLGSGRVPSTVDPDSVLAMAKHDSKSHKRPVRISAWRLAKLNPDEAARAALKARENSSILRPIGAQSLKGTETDYSSSSNISTRSSVSNDYGLMNNSKRRARDILLSKSITPPPRQSTDDLCLPFEQRIRSTYSSPNYSVNGSGVMSPVPEEQNSSPPSSFHTTNSRLRPASLGTTFTSQRATLPPLPQQAPAEYLNWVSNTPASDGYEASGGESGDDVPRPIRFLASGKVEEHGFNETMRGSNYSHLVQLQKARNSLSTSDAPVIVGMKQVWAENSPSPSPSSISDASIAHGYASERPIQEQTPQDGSSISKPLSQSTENLSHAGSKSTENLQYSGTSIFYGGPISFLESNGRTDSTAHLPLHASNPLVLKTMADFPQKPSQDCKLLLQRAALARSQSPVFVPRNLSANSSQLS